MKMGRDTGKPIIWEEITGRHSRRALQCHMYSYSCKEKFRLWRSGWKTLLNLETWSSIILTSISHQMVLSFHLLDTCFNSTLLWKKAQSIFHPSAAPLRGKKSSQLGESFRSRMRCGSFSENFQITCGVFAWSYPSVHSLPLVANIGHFMQSNQNLRLAVSGL